MHKNCFAARCFSAVGNKAELQQRLFIFWLQSQVIHPLEEIGARLITHPRCKAAGEAVLLEKRAETFPQEILRVKRQRPVKTVTHKNQIKVTEPDSRIKLQFAACNSLISLLAADSR